MQMTTKKHAPPVPGIDTMLPRDRIPEGSRKLRDALAITPGAPIFQREFGFFFRGDWRRQGMDPDADPRELFGFDEGSCGLEGLGWIAAAFDPPFEEKLIENRGEHDLVQNASGQHVLVFKGRRIDFMPEYLDHPVKDRKSWEEKCKWRMDPASPNRRDERQRNALASAREAARQGRPVVQQLVGGYMYLRSLIGPADLMYAFYDMPDVIHDCMASWLALADAVIAWHQEEVTLDILFLAEDNCYNHGLLISPDMMREFLFPYYQQLITNIKSRQRDPNRPFYVQVDTDGDCRPALPLYHDEIGLNMMTPFEVAAGNDVIEIGRQYPWLVITGGMDKRELAKGPREIDAMVERIVPVMRERGGYIPTCDHCVSADQISFANYMHYRKRMLELGG
jgi:hypothetical protein